MLSNILGINPIFSPAAGNLKEKTSFLAFSGHPLSIHIITFNFFLGIFIFEIFWGVGKNLNQLKLEVLCLACSCAPQAKFFGFCACLDQWFR